MYTNGRIISSYMEVNQYGQEHRRYEPFRGSEIYARALGLMRKCYELERENERLRDCIDTLDRQNDELKALLKGEGVVQ